MINTLVPIAGALDYTKVSRIIDTRGRKGVSKIAANTQLQDNRRTHGFLSLMLYGNEIIRFYADGNIQLFHRDSYTDVTKKRINQFSPHKVYTLNGKYYHMSGEPFRNGDLISSNGAITHLS